MIEQLHSPNQSPVQRVLGEIAARATGIVEDIKRGFSEAWDAGNFPTVYQPNRNQSTDAIGQNSTESN